MTPLLLLGVGVVVLGAGIAVLRSFGRGYRVGRLLAVTPRVSVDEAIALAGSGQRRYVRVDGRLDSAQDFPDEHQRPLVFRRRRLQVRRGGRWRTLDDAREAVPFEIREGVASIGIDHAALDDGLVVLPRESTGTAGEIPDRVPPDVPPATPARLRVDQVSSIEHAIVLGIPARAGDGAQITAGLGRPLVLSTLELPEAMRVLGGGRLRAAVAAAALTVGAALVLIGASWALIGGLR